MALVFRLAQQSFRLINLSMTLKLAWAVWLSIVWALTIWRRHGRTEMIATPVPRRRNADNDASQPSKTRWRLRANTETPVLPQTSMLGL
jgi:hypothetical protein